MRDPSDIVKLISGSCKLTDQVDQEIGSWRRSVMCDVQSKQY